MIFSAKDADLPAQIKDDKVKSAESISLKAVRVRAPLAYVPSYAYEFKFAKYTVVSQRLIFPMALS